MSLSHRHQSHRFQTSYVSVATVDVLIAIIAFGCGVAIGRNFEWL
jgi:hypothetical protein